MLKWFHFRRTLKIPYIAGQSHKIIIISHQFPPHPGISRLVSHRPRDHSCAIQLSATRDTLVDDKPFIKHMFYGPIQTTRKLSFSEVDFIEELEFIGFWSRLLKFILPQLGFSGMQIWYKWTSPRWGFGLSWFLNNIVISVCYGNKPKHCRPTEEDFWSHWNQLLKMTKISW